MFTYGHRLRSSASRLPQNLGNGQRIEPVPRCWGSVDRHRSLGKMIVKLVGEARRVWLITIRPQLPFPVSIAVGMASVRCSGLELLGTKDEAPAADRLNLRHLLHGLILPFRCVSLFTPFSPRGHADLRLSVSSWRAPPQKSSLINPGWCAARNRSFCVSGRWIFFSR